VDSPSHTQFTNWPPTLPLTLSLRSQTAEPVGGVGGQFVNCVWLGGPTRIVGCIRCTHARSEPPNLAGTATMRGAPGPQILVGVPAQAYTCESTG
jgi:hypothetical protein